ncbi:MAG: leucine-rich repeat domain-containing protein [Erysipelotrichaceae bacterium]|nr:leucine-rich repeat domain-containing protein [Erysipelotrichaceae bacterium]
MANVIINDTHLNNIASAIREKNGTTTKYKPSEMPTAISAIETGSGGSSDEWQPQPDWWDIDTILENDTEDYEGKMIVLFTDENDTTTFNYASSHNVAKLKLSDGTIYDYNKTITHTWDTTKDKECSFGYKTRYYIVYFSSTEVPVYNNSMLTYSNDNSNSLLYVIFKNLNITVNSASGNTFFNNNLLLERVKCINSTINASTHVFSGCRNLIEVDNVILKKGFYCFNGCRKLKKLNNLSLSSTNKGINYCFDSTSIEVIDIDTSMITNFQNAFSSCYYLRKIIKLDFASATNVSSTFNNCNNLLEIVQISNIKITGLNFSSSTLLRRESLLKILNALYDYAAEGSTDTYTLIVGTKNLAKLSDEEKAIATNKGWTLAKG